MLIIPHSQPPDTSASSGTSSERIERTFFTSTD